MALKTKIACNAVRPTKSAVYLLAAELMEVEGITAFRAAVIEALKSYDYYDTYYYAYYCDYYYCGYAYYYDYCGDDYKSIPEKVLALLFLSAMYS